MVHRTLRRRYPAFFSEAPERNFPITLVSEEISTSYLWVIPLLPSPSSSNMLNKLLQLVSIRVVKVPRLLVLQPRSPRIIPQGNSKSKEVR